ncbi:magnesium transporter CorA family protein [Ancylobacter sp. A5.8]|uniref:magnesium transporter CorA family protein n=1 Tax=Ancylobacter gelatini TaxID=2919920 RepID=UPI001F4E6156|nr:magnesium transporter CorA family protein [Ancylobacter gelatini]MCJ8144614.1 magnesium transporter CorA family protein [Ancylobacter gelatini]
MITAYCPRGGALQRVSLTPDSALPDDAVWIDLFEPTPDEDQRVEAALGIAIPTREEMVEIEPSSRLRVEGGASYMTGSVVCNSETEHPRLSEVSFILSGGRLTTVRYAQSRPFSMTESRLGKSCPPGYSGEQLMLELLDAIVDRAADIIERLSAEIEGVSHRVFERDEASAGGSQRYRILLRMIGARATLASQVRESLVSMGRLATFLAAENGVRHFSKDQRVMIKSQQRDIASLNNHVSYLGDKVTFLLDATLGMVSIEQNNIIKIFAVLSVVLMPPTLIASIYGMNFEHMPELDERWGYPAALVAMMVAAIVPYLLFKWKRWL